VVRIQVGEVRIETDQPITARQLHALLGKATTIALMLNPEAEEEETKPTVSLGFTTEIAEVLEPDFSEYFEEERVTLDPPT